MRRDRRRSGGGTLSARARARRALVQFAVTAAPKGQHVVVAGWPDDEANAVEVVRALTMRGTHTVFWLVDDPPEELTWLLDGVAASTRLHLVSKRSLRGFLAYLTARTVFFTHGLYDSPKPPRRAVFVNLWHGDGPKRAANPNYGSLLPSTVVVAGTRLWGQTKVRGFGLRADQLLVTGNPRIDQFARRATNADLRGLDLDPSQPFVLWMPTYRRTNQSGTRRWSDARDLTKHREVLDLLPLVQQAAADVNVRLVVKPHPLDADDFGDTGVHVLTTARLRQAHIGLYQLVARSAGLITDYSSVWTDYLALDRPAGFYCPDLDQYAAGGRLNVEDLPPLLPGPLLSSVDDFRHFFRACLEEPAALRQQRQQSIARIGATTRLGATERLLGEVL